MTDPTSPFPSERKRGTGSKMAYELMRDEILDLTLVPGSPIDEAQLAERFAMSRTPVREALVRLESEGLVQTLPNRSTMVAAIDFLNLNAFFDALTLMYRVTGRLAADNRRAEDLVTLRARQADFAAAVERGDVLAMIATNRDFHTAIAEAGRNIYFTQLFNRLLDEGRRLLRLYYRSFEDRLPQRYVEEHEALIAVIEAGDANAADRISRAHAEQIVAQISRFFASETRPEIDLS